MRTRGGQAPYTARGKEQETRTARTGEKEVSASRKKIRWPGRISRGVGCVVAQRGLYVDGRKEVRGRGEGNVTPLVGRRVLNPS